MSASKPSIYQTTDATQPQLQRRKDRARDLAETLLARTGPLPSGDRALLEAVYDRGETFITLSHLLQRDRKWISRRVRMLTARLLSHEYAFVLRSMERWPMTMRSVAREVYLLGRGLRAASASLKLTYHTIRRHRDSIQTLINADREREKPVVTAHAVTAGESARVAGPALARRQQGAA